MHKVWWTLTEKFPKTAPKKLCEDLKHESFFLHICSLYTSQKVEFKIFKKYQNSSLLTKHVCCSALNLYFVLCIFEMVHDMLLSFFHSYTVLEYQIKCISYAGTQQQRRQRGLPPPFFSQEQIFLNSHLKIELLWSCPHPYLRA